MPNAVEDVRRLDEFQMHADEILKRVKETGSPLLLTVDGKAELVIQDAEAYSRLLDLLDRAEAIQGIQRGIEEMERGEGLPAAAAFAAIRRKYGPHQAE